MEAYLQWWDCRDFDYREMEDFMQNKPMFLDEGYLFGENDKALSN